MSRQFLCVITLCLLAATPAWAVHVKVFLLAGQSNMAGSGQQADLPVELQSPQDDILFYEGSSLTTLRPRGNGGFGPEITFGRTIADAFPNDTFAIIKHAVGGTDLDYAWDPVVGNQYANFRGKIIRGLYELNNAGHTTEIVGMLWTQGERDVSIGTSAAYETNLNGLIADVRTRYGTDLPFFVSQLSSGQTDLVERSSQAEFDAVRNAQAAVAANDPNTHLIVTDDFELWSDALHFNSAGQIALGEAFAQQYIQSVPEPASLAALAIGGLAMMRRRR